MKLFTMEPDQDTLAAEIEAIQNEKEAAISSLVAAKEDLLKAKDAIFYTIGAETYAQFNAGSNECELMSHFLQIKDIEEQVLATDEKMAEIAQHYDAEIAALEAGGTRTPEEAPAISEPQPEAVEVPVVEASAAVEAIPEVAPIPAPEAPVVEPPVAPPVVVNAFCENCG